MPAAESVSARRKLDFQKSATIFQLGYSPEVIRCHPHPARNI